MDEDGSCRVLTFFMSSQITSGDVESGDVDEEAILSYSQNRTTYEPEF